MSDRRAPPKYVSASGPVNRRTAPRPEPRIAPQVVTRLQQSKLRNRMGGSLADQLRARASDANVVPLDRATVGAGVATTASAVTLMLAWLQASGAVATLGLAALAASGGWLGWRLHRRSRQASAGEAPPQPLFDPASVATLDQALQALAGQIPEATAARLAAIKQLIVRIGTQPAAATVNEHFTMEDRLYVVECVRRYLPDSLQSYLKVPPARRDLPLQGEAESAVAQLDSQLALLQAELEQREARLARAAGEDLLAQRRFLESKSR